MRSGERASSSGVGGYLARVDLINAAASSYPALLRFAIAVVILAAFGALGAVVVQGVVRNRRAARASRSS